MERPERYDPEDIEHLMLERSFDELLAEEQAFVLRHLQDSSEYERMRTLLLHMQIQDGQASPIDADPVVRERVLRAFRDQRQPRLKIWLNSVGAFLLPARPVHYWRPALALGTLALLIISSLSLWNTVQGPQPQILADLKEVPASPEIRNAGPTVTTDTTVDMDVPLPSTAVVPSPTMEQAVQPAPEAPPATMEVFKEAESYVAEAALAKVESRVAEVADPAPTVAGAAANHDVAITSRVMAKHSTSTGFATADDLASGGPSEDALLGLLRAAW